MLNDPADLDFHLPPDLIARSAAEPRDSARMMVYHRNTGQLRHARIRDLPTVGHIQPNDLLLANQTRVLPARFDAVRANTGGRMSGLFLNEPSPHTWDVLLESRGTLQPGEAVTLSDDVVLTLHERTGPGQWRAACNAREPAAAVLARLGDVPLPPYIRKARKLAGEPEALPTDAARYNTVFADPRADAGSVAAPTAGLHFTDDLLRTLDDQGVRRAFVTLHVGVGTFAPIKADTLDGHTMHAEAYHIDANTLRAIRDTRAAGGHIVCVGTTTVRAVESLPPDALDPATPPRDHAGQTNLFIRPGFDFRFTDALLTNFHLPRSTLLALVAALPNLGLPTLLTLYQHAITNHYRFYSFGDAMLIV